MPTNITNLICVKAVDEKIKRGTKPNFVGNTLTMKEYLNGEFENTKYQDGGMNIE